MIPRRPLASLAAASLVALAGCSDGPFGPIGPLAGDVFALSHVNGQPLPVVLWEDAAGVRLEIVDETLAFHPFGRVERARTLRYADADGAAQATTIRNVTYYRVREGPTEVSATGLVLRIGSFVECPAPSPTSLSVACDPEEQAVVDGDALQLTSIAYGAMSAIPLAMRFELADAVR